MARARPSMAFDKLSGTVDAVTLVAGPKGLVVRRKAVYRRATSARQQAAAERFRQAGALWGSFGHEQAQLWEQYAQTLVRRDRITGTLYSPNGQNAFVALATKLLQIDPEGPVPTTPPVGEFLGDVVAVSVVAQPQGLLFVADRPNLPGILIELIVQTLPNPRTKPGRVYPSQGFVAFVPGGLSRLVPLAIGWYAPAFRFVEQATGRQTDLLRLPPLAIDPPLPRVRDSSNPDELA